MLSRSSKSSCCFAHLMISSASFTPHSLPLCRLTFSSLPPRTQPHGCSHGRASAVGRPWVVSIIIHILPYSFSQKYICLCLPGLLSTPHSSVLSLPNSCRTRHIVYHFLKCHRLRNIIPRPFAIKYMWVHLSLKCMRSADVYL